MWGALAVAGLLCRDARARSPPAPWGRAMTPHGLVALEPHPAAPPYRQGPLCTDHLESDHNVLPTTQHRATYSKGTTNHIERFNNTLRQRLGRLVRKVLSFSKCPIMHEIVIRIIIDTQ